MMKVNGHWERADTLEDISRIIREHYNSELADKMDYLIDIDFRIKELEEAFKLSKWKAEDWLDKFATRMDEVKNECNSSKSL